jgi:hypothetical protein
MWYIDPTRWIHDNLKVNWLVGKKLSPDKFKRNLSHFAILDSYKRGEGVYDSLNSAGRDKNS